MQNQIKLTEFELIIKCKLAHTTCKLLPKNKFEAVVRAKMSKVCNIADSHLLHKINKKKNQDKIDKDKNSEFSEWYTQVILKSEMIDYSDISGCYILRPHSYEIWEIIKEFIDKEIKKMGVKNSYFPLFVSKSALESEKNHIEGFSAEVAWVTRSGQSELTIPIAIRPTSETIMYPHYAKWIKSHRDLPLKYNQWNNAVRWEFKSPTPFIRSREFLWQEGHTAHSLKHESEREMKEILDLYERVYEELLAVPVTKGLKTDIEKFAGGISTGTVEAYIPACGKGVQGATSHCLGQNFAKIFDIKYENETGQREYVWQNSWGLTTRTIGVAVMIHSDNSGLVLPPKIAPIQIIIVPILFANKSGSNMCDKIKLQAHILNQQLLAVGLRSQVDNGTQTPGWKYCYWELRGVCIRIEIGPKDMEANKYQVKRRDQMFQPSKSVNWNNTVEHIQNQLEQMQQDMFQKAKTEMLQKRTTVTTWADFTKAINNQHSVIAPFCLTGECEKSIKERSSCKTDPNQNKNISSTLTGSAKSMCVPYDQPPISQDTKCFACDQEAVKWVLFGRCY